MNISDYLCYCVMISEHFTVYVYVGGKMIWIQHVYTYPAGEEPWLADLVLPVVICLWVGTAGEWCKGDDVGVWQSSSSLLQLNLLGEVSECVESRFIELSPLLIFSSICTFSIFLFHYFEFAISILYRMLVLLISLA